MVCEIDAPPAEHAGVAQRQKAILARDAQQAGIRRLAVEGVQIRPRLRALVIFQVALELDQVGIQKTTAEQLGVLVGGLRQRLAQKIKPKSLTRRDKVL